ncbi:DUF934 domain-containing protein [Erythrobacter sp. SD-21]|uniref:DUF934 domain-containing protein n=1 Tax=Erythrobacter sp. SD-21 TaxID=161528 RepID=UPI000153F5A9|nr:DUF934 domain-containing protein [Erythrobacter sp. SD-21]EDL49354.1 hypothetical protein ED21_21779 [Erythrobacter sp. SD-21]
MTIVTPAGFRPDDNRSYAPHDDLPAGTDLAVDLPNDADPVVLAQRLGDIALIRIPFPTYGDGRGFSIARELREMGFAGTLRASGYVISDQFRHALQSGFDEVEIDEALAVRQPEDLWRFEDWKSYRAKLAQDAA